MEPKKARAKQRNELSDIRAKQAPTDVGYTYKWSKLELAGATFQDCSTPQNVTSCEGIRSLAPKKAPEPLKKPFRPQMLYTSVS